MSVLIKGIKKPKRCSGFDGSKCPFLDDEDNCVLQELIGGTWDDLYANCPLVELPERHGDLIDRDALRKGNQMNDDCSTCVRDVEKCRYDMSYILMDFCSWLDDALVVIEAEGEE